MVNTALKLSFVKHEVADHK